MSDAARVLGVHPQTVRRWTKEGILPFTWTPGGERRFLLSELDAFARKQTAPNKTKAAS